MHHTKLAADKLKRHTMTPMPPISCDDRLPKHRIYTSIAESEGRPCYGFGHAFRHTIDRTMNSVGNPSMGACLAATPLIDFTK